MIKHKRLNIKGVIIGWDEKAKAPDEWIDRNYSEEEVFCEEFVVLHKHLF